MKSYWKMSLILSMLAINISLMGNTFIGEILEHVPFKAYGIVTKDLLGTVVITPLLEESIKWFGFYILFRSFSRDRALAGSFILALTFGISERLIQSGGYMTMGLSAITVGYYVLRFGVFAANHVLFWTPIAVGGVNVVGFVLAVIIHSAWNFGVTAPGEWSLVGTGINLIAFALPIVFLIRSTGDRDENSE